MQAVLLIVAIVLALLVNLAGSALHREHRRVRLIKPRYYDGGLTPYELAYLSGGPRRVIDTALSVLVGSHAIRVARGGQVSLVSGGPSSTDPIEHALLETLSARGGSCPVGELRRTVAEFEALSALRNLLLGIRLIVPDEAFGRARKLLNRLLLLSLLALAVEVGLPAFGVLTGSIDVITGSMGVITLLAGAFAVISGLTTYFRVKRALRNVLSQAGHDALDSARRNHVRGARTTPHTMDYDRTHAINYDQAVMAYRTPVALYGPGELGDPDLEKELNRDSGYTSTTGCAAGSCGGGASSFGSSGDFGSGGWSGGDSGGGSSGGSSCGGGGGGD